MNIVIVNKKGEIQTVCVLSIGASLEIIEDGFQIEITDTELFDSIKVAPHKFTYDLKSKSFIKDETKELIYSISKPQ